MVLELGSIDISSWSNGSMITNTNLGRVNSVEFKSDTCTDEVKIIKLNFTCNNLILVGIEKIRFRDQIS